MCTKYAIIKAISGICHIFRVKYNRLLFWDSICFFSKYRSWNSVMLQGLIVQSFIFILFFTDGGAMIANFADCS